MTEARNESTEALRGADIRFRVDPGDVPPEKAARRLHLTLDRFNELLPNLLKRGFPPADPDTGMYSLEAIDEWRKVRDGLKSPLTGASHPPQANQPADKPMSMGERFAAKKRSRHG
ncbi:hypothetical protein [Bradyrhizobium embrapense]|uniref:hypothetical protein n=1 Tax=Bradyrhizobium embrapense TaxID=630921 RepID=UPI000B204060|nr:hypothetical protein [Bradyrhizobium embrapense]